MTSDDYFYAMCLGWEKTFAWLPKSCNITKKRIWLKYALRGTRMIYGPAGELPIIEYRWHDIKEHIFWKLKNERAN